MAELYDRKKIPDDLQQYFVRAELGLEPTPEAYVEKLVAIFGEVRRVLRDDGTLWLNLGDSYARPGAKGGSGTPTGRNNRGERYAGAEKSVPSGLKEKDLVGIPWRVVFALQEDGWWLRSDIIWHKPNPMPESVTDRPTSAHEHIFLLAKRKSYYYDYEAIKENSADPEGSKARYEYEFSGTERSDPGDHDRIVPEGERDFDGKRNKRDVWTVTTKPYPDAHFAVYPPDLIVPCIKAGSAEGDLVLDPFCGAGTTGVVCTKLGRRFLGIELNEEYADMARDRINGVPLSLFRGGDK